jgi:hypothetical protein
MHYDIIGGASKSILYIHKDMHLAGRRVRNASCCRRITSIIGASRAETDALAVRCLQDRTITIAHECNVHIVTAIMKNYVQLEVRGILGSMYKCI